MQYGIDTLGGVNYKDAIKSLPTDCALGLFAETFGDAFRLTKTLLRQGRIIRVQLVWKDDHDYGRKELEQAKKLVQKYAKLSELFDTKLYLSPFCEHRISNPDAFLDELNDYAFGDVILVNTPLKEGALSKRYINEIHGEDLRRPKGKYFYSYDGTAAVDSDVERMKRRHRDVDIFFLWTYQCNGRCNEKDKTPRAERKAWPTKELLESLNALTASKGKVGLIENTLWKSHAEQTKNQPMELEPRACKPVVITPVKGKTCKLIRNNKIIAVSGARMPYADGRWRYYFSEYGYEYGVCELYCDEVKLGTINAGFREGVFRS